MQHANANKHARGIIHCSKNSLFVRMLGRMKIQLTSSLESCALFFALKYFMFLEIAFPCVTCCILIADTNLRRSRLTRADDGKSSIAGNKLLNPPKHDLPAICCHKTHHAKNTTTDVVSCRGVTRQVAITQGSVRWSP